MVGRGLTVALSKLLVLYAQPTPMTLRVLTWTIVARTRRRTWPGPGPGPGQGQGHAAGPGQVNAADQLTSSTSPD